MKTGYLIDDYYKGPVHIQKRAVCSVSGKILAYSYQAFTRINNFCSEDYLNEQEAINEIFVKVKALKEAADKELNEIESMLNKEYVNEK